MGRNNELVDYDQALEALANNSISLEFSNTDDDHALLVFKHMFRNASKYIRIACGCLNDNFTSDTEYQESLKIFLDKDDTNLRIIMTENISPDNFRKSTIGKLLTRYSNKVELKTTSDYFYNDDNQEHKIHFCVADDLMFRFETDINKRQAFCNFNDKNICKKLISTFDKCFASNNSSPLMSL